MTTAIEMRNIRKYFASSSTLALDQVNFEVQPGEVHALVGENGAGKTTLMNVLYGLVSPDEGEILVQGKPVQISHPDHAIQQGIGMVHQHFKLVPSFTIAENIMLGVEPNQFGVLNSSTEAEAVRKLAADYGLPVDPNKRIQDVSVGIQQRVEILKSLQRDARVLILDEPTAVLTPQEVRELYVVIRRLAESGRSVILITHKLLEVKEVADRLTVMRRGKVVGTDDVANVSVRDIANMMVGRQVILTVPRTPAEPGETVLEVENLLVADNKGLPAVMGASLQLRKGEILGIAGISGNGQTELVEAIAGTRPIDGGDVRLLGESLVGKTVRQRRDVGMAHIPEDRMTSGLNMTTTLDENVVVTSYDREPYSKGGYLQFDAIRQLAQQIAKTFHIKSAAAGGNVRTLSGGNLQKIVLGRELEGDPALIIANQPTRGVDVGSIEFVHKTLVDVRDHGAAILLISVELDEILALSDRVAVMYEGRIVATLDMDEVNEEKLGLLMAGSSLPQDDALAYEEMN
ncbi:MAG: heme ABC transporter ATP-binding protein [Anaerolineaceae bacterium]|nr:heme ABC transporter ATP-binding protein [Anaerolineaceae bacterium]